VRLVVWNSQGGKWDALWTNWIEPYASPVAPNPAEDVIALVVEAGWAPWVKSGLVTQNAEYFLDSSLTYHDETSADASAFCRGVMAARRRKAMWIPWVPRPGDFINPSNTRCSMGAVVCTRQLMLQRADRLDLTREGHLRPVVRVELGIGKNTLITIFLVHLKSGYAPNAQAELDGLTTQMTKRIPEGSAALVVGDMNIPGPVPPPARWQVLDGKPPSDVGTHSSLRDLDWGLLYDPSNYFKAPQASVLEKWKTAKNGSDHSVMSYVLPH
jgi:hypothetical protein